MAEWMAGVAEREITPPLGASMTGYAGRPGPADRVLDPLYVRALALRPDSGAPVVLTGADLLGISGQMVAEIRAAVATRVPAERLLLNHSHTHSGPTTAPLRCMGTPSAAYNAQVVEHTAAVILEALDRMQPARLGYGTAPTTIGGNRRELRDGKIVLGHHEAGAYDPEVYVLRVEGEDGSPLACWFSHATHPVIMGSANTGISAEWPGAAAAALRRTLGCPALFAQGCCGDVNPTGRGDHAEVVRVGDVLAADVLRAWEAAEPMTGGVTAGALERVQLPQLKPSVDEAEAAFTEAAAERAAVEDELRAVQPALAEDERRRRLEVPQAMLEWARDYRRAAQSPESPSVGMDVQALRVGDVALVATAAETFIAIGQEIQRRSPFAHTVVLGYSNGCFGYLPTACAFPLGGYEIDRAFQFYGTLMVTPQAEALTLEAAARVLHRLRD